MKINGNTIKAAARRGYTLQISQHAPEGYEGAYSLQCFSDVIVARVVNGRKNHRWIRSAEYGWITVCGAPGEMTRIGWKLSSKKCPKCFNLAPRVGEKGKGNEKI